MTTRTLLHWLVPVVVSAGAVGCGGTPPPTEPATLAPVIVAPVTVDPRSTEPATVQTQATPTTTQPAKPAESPVTLPADTGGKAVGKVLMLPPPLPAQAPVAVKSVQHTSALDRGELPLPPVAMTPFSPVEPKGNTVKPSPPVERSLPDAMVTTLPDGRAISRALAKALAPPNAGAADVPLNAWRQGDRAPLVDPTADLSAGRVIETPLPASTGQLPFLRAFIPKPFEYAEQLKGKLGKDTELGTQPVPVSPAKQ